MISKDNKNQLMATQIELINADFLEQKSKESGGKVRLSLSPFNWILEYKKFLELLIYYCCFAILNTKENLKWRTKYEFVVAGIHHFSSKYWHHAHSF